MRLTRHVDLALRTLMYLGLSDDRVCTIAEVAAAYGISESHLMKVVHRLGVRGLVQTVRGHGAGLAEPLPHPGRFYRLLEDDLGLVECFDSRTNTCPIAGACALTGILDEALDAFLGVLDRHSVADLLSSRGALLRRLETADRTVVGRREETRSVRAAAKTGSSEKRPPDWVSALDSPDFPGLPAARARRSPAPRTAGRLRECAAAEQRSGTAPRWRARPGAASRPGWRRAGPRRSARR